MAVTAWLPLGVGQVAAAAGDASFVMIMPSESVSTESPPISVRTEVRLDCGVCDLVPEVMSRFLLPWSGGQSFPAPAPEVTEAMTDEAGSAV